jgi:hypothetical protein
VSLEAARWSRAMRTVAVVLTIVLLLVMRVLASAKDELARADAALERSDVEGAIVHYRRAARFYVPASPLHVRGLVALERIAVQAEQAGDSERALSAYRAVRGSIMATRSFYVPERARLARVDARIAALMASQAAPTVDLGKSREQITQEHLALLERVPGPSVAWTLVLLVGFLGWVLGAFAFSAKAVDDQDRWVLVEAKKWGAVIVLGFGLFVLGLSLA